MIAKLLAAIWTAIAPSLGNHLWQSTLFACVIALLTLVLRNNRAQIRYWLWLAASLKFLVPFSLLAGMGSYLASPRASAPSETRLYFAMEQVGQPFTRQTVAAIPHTTPSGVSQNLIYLLPALLVVWLCGFAVVLFVWCVRWRRISAAVRESEPLHEGREVEALHHLENLAGMPKHVAIRSSHGSLEPGIFGIVRPVLLWPQGINGRLEDAHLKSILAHELLHIRRRDNLAAAVHMLVEAAFWFHPLVWWMGTRLVDERERACDEEVLQSGSDRQVYAESILKICEFCVGSPLTCVSGVTGAELKSRITRIMSHQVARKLDFSRKLLLGAGAVLAVAAPIAAGMLHAPPSRVASQFQNATVAIPAYATVMIAPSKSSGDTLMFGSDEFISKNASLQQVIRVAYGVEDDRIVGAPTWLASEKYDVEAREDSSAVNDPRKLSLDQRVSEQKVMLQALLADRLKLALHRETRELSVFALVVSRGGPKLQQSKPGDAYPNGFKGPDGVARPGFHFKGNNLIGQGVPIAPLLSHLSWQLRRTLLDETGLSGTYDFAVQVPQGIPLGFDNPTPPESYESALSAAIEQQLGLKLEPRKASMEVLVIDHVEKPSEFQAQNSTAKAPVYEIASIKLDQAGTASLQTGKGIIRQRLLLTPGVFAATNVSTLDLIRTAYGIKDYQISGVPDWFHSELYDVDAKAEQSVIDDLQKLGNDQRNLENQSLAQAFLEHHFKMTFHHETKDVPFYSLVVAEPGKLHEAHGDCGPPPALQPEWRPGKPIPPPPCGSLRTSSWDGRFDGLKVPMTQLVDDLSNLTNTMVKDKTNLAGKYDMNLEWAPDPSQLPPRPAGLPPIDPPYSNRVPLLTALQQQLGLKLELQTAPTDILVIDHVEKPTEN
jgi:bla regulator protein blaR1